MATATRRYEVHARAKARDAWATVYYADNLGAARRYAAGLLAGGKVQAVRVWDAVTGEAVGDG